MSFLRRILCPGSESVHKEAATATYSVRPGNEAGSDVVCVLPGIELLSALTGPAGGAQALAAAVPDFAPPWSEGTDTCFGQSISLYEKAACGAHSGDPVADCYGALIYGRQDGQGHTGAVLAVADGVGWGEPARRAARCAVLGCLSHTHEALKQLHHTSGLTGSVTSSRLFHELVESIHTAHRLILKQMGTVTTLVVTLLLPKATQRTGCWLLSRQGARHAADTPWVAMTVTVGDSAAWVWRHKSQRVDELTAAAHAGVARDRCEPMGGLGYALGEDPDLTNMTLSVTLIEQGDYVFLGSDGVVDNFQADPDTIKLETPSTHKASTQDGLIGLECGESESCDEETARPSPEQMQCAHLQLLGDAVRQAAQPAGHALGATQPAGHTVQAAQAAGHAGPQQTEQVSSGGGTRSSPLSARQLTLHLLEHVNKYTEPLRRATEELVRAQSAKPSKAWSGPRPKMPPGKLDHCTVLSYQVAISVCGQALFLVPQQDASLDSQTHMVLVALCYDFHASSYGMLVWLFMFLLDKVIDIE